MIARADSKGRFFIFELTSGIFLYFEFSFDLFFRCKASVQFHCRFHFHFSGAKFATFVCLTVSRVLSGPLIPFDFLTAETEPPKNEKEEEEE